VRDRKVEAALRDLFTEKVNNKCGSISKYRTLVDALPYGAQLDIAKGSPYYFGGD